MRRVSVSLYFGKTSLRSLFTRVLYQIKCFGMQAFLTLILDSGETSSRRSYSSDLPCHMLCDFHMQTALSVTSRVDKRLGH